MTNPITDYIKEINLLYQTGLTTEHSFRPALQRLLQECTQCTVINEQSHIDCGAPDLTLLHKEMPIAYVEAKDLEDGDLDGRKKNKEQFNRYKNALETIVFTDYLDFHLYSEGELLMQVQIATTQNSHIVLNDDAVARFESLIQRLKEAKPQRITSSVKLAKLMAGKARLMADAVQKGLSNDVEKKGSLWHQLMAFKEVLNNDLDETRFADLYAQTIAYGLFAARIHDTTPETFTRQEAASLIPHSNPFLRQIFQQLAGYDINDSIAWIVDDLVNIFAVTDVKNLRKNFTKENQHRDPMIHFYEDFLQYYDPASKKKYGVYYTPQPIVEFIVRAVDDLLKEDFGIKNGLADTSKGEYEIEKEDKELNKIVKRVETLHRTQ
ncbi:MAG: N-6 DNA methylase, partial [Prevotella sp.]|nr:N-6 DNA methylase [Prevotella sp.]